MKARWIARNSFFGLRLSAACLLGRQGLIACRSVLNLLVEVKEGMGSTYEPGALYIVLSIRDHSLVSC